jgi:hypothetical protein
MVQPDAAPVPPLLLAQPTAPAAQPVVASPQPSAAPQLGLTGSSGGGVVWDVLALRQQAANISVDEVCRAWDAQTILEVSTERETRWDPRSFRASFEEWAKVGAKNLLELEVNHSVSFLPFPSGHPWVVAPERWIGCVAASSEFCPCLIFLFGALLISFSGSD